MSNLNRRYIAKPISNAAMTIILVMLLSIAVAAVPSITAPTPPGGQTAFKDGDTIAIPFDVDGNTNMKIELSTDGGATWVAPAIYTSTVADAEMSPFLGTMAGGFTSANCVLRITVDSGGPATTATSGVFAIDNTLPLFAANPAVNPSGWTNGNSVMLSWTGSDADSGLVDEEYQIDGGGYTPSASGNPVDVSGLSDGTHSIDVQLTDNAGNTTTKSVDVKIDRTQPNAFAPSANPASWTNANSIAITFSATDATAGIKQYEVALDAGAYSVHTNPYSLNVAAVSDGSHTVHVKAIDNAGNERIQDVTISLDKTAPVAFTATPDTANWTKNNVNVAFLTTDATSGIDHYAVAEDGGLYNTHASPYVMSKEGTHVVHVKAVDAANNEKIAVDVTTKIDKTAPMFTVNPAANPSGWTNGNSVTLSWTGSDAVSGLADEEYQIDGGGYTPGASGNPVDVSGLSDGTHTIDVKLTDNAGNTAKKSVDVKIDRTQPGNFTPIANPASWTKASNVSITFSTTDAASGINHYEVAVDGGAYAVQTNPYTVNASVMTDGMHTVHVKAVDNALNERVNDVTIYLDKTAPASFAPTANPSSWTNASSVSISFSTTDAASGMNHYEVSLDSGAYAVQTSPYALNVASVADGTHTVHVKAVDNAANEVIKDVVVYIDKTPPSVSISAPSGTMTGSGPITYTVNYSDSNGIAAITLANANVILNKTGTANGIVNVTGAGLAARTVTISGITGNGTLGISLSAGTATDISGNLAPAKGPSTTFTVDNTPADNTPPALAIAIQVNKGNGSWVPIDEPILWKNRGYSYRVVWDATDQNGVQTANVKWRNGGVAWPNDITGSKTGTILDLNAISGVIDLDSFEVEVYAMDNVGNAAQLVAKRPDGGTVFGIYNLSNIGAPTVKIITPASNGTVFMAGMQITIKVQVSTNAFHVPGSSTTTYMADASRYWMDASSQSCPTKLRWYTPKTAKNGVPKSLAASGDITLPTAAVILAKNESAIVPAGNAANRKVTYEWTQLITLVRGTPRAGHPEEIKINPKLAYQVEVPYTSARNLAGQVQANKVGPVPSSEPLGSYLLQREFARFWIWSF